MRYNFGLKKSWGFGRTRPSIVCVTKPSIYISSYDMISPKWVTITQGITTRNNAILVPAVFHNTSESSFYVWIRKSPSCVVCHRPRGYYGKNFNYFLGPTLKSSRVEL
jgi:hypothetical protein